MQNPYENIRAAVLAAQAEDRFLDHKDLTLTRTVRRGITKIRA
jgi:hypothetical protein